MATIKQKQYMIDCLLARVITIQLSRDDYNEYQKWYNIWNDSDTQTTKSIRSKMETAYYYLKDEFITQLGHHGYDVLYDWDDNGFVEWHDAFEYAYLDGANESPVFETPRGETIKLRFEWF